MKFNDVPSVQTSLAYAARCGRLEAALEMVLKAFDGEEVSPAAIALCRLVLTEKWRSQ